MSAIIGFFLSIMIFFPSPPRGILFSREQLDLPLEKKELISALPELASPPQNLPMKRVKVQVAQATSGQLESWFENYGNTYGVDKAILKRIAACESGFNNGSTSGLYAGMFQFASETWKSTRQEMGLDPNPNLRFNAEESIKTTAFKISRGGISAWPVCGRS